MGEGFIEGNSLNYSFHAPQDVYGMMKMMGGEKIFTSRMDELFGMDLPEYCYATNEDITKDCLDRWLCARKRAKSPYHLPICLDFTALEDSILAQGSSE
jgi:hypothetical protein